MCLKINKESVGLVHGLLFFFGKFCSSITCLLMWLLLICLACAAVTYDYRVKWNHVGIVISGLLQQCIGAKRASHSVKRMMSSPRYRQDRLCASVGCRTAAPPLVAGGHLLRESRCLCFSVSLQRLCHVVRQRSDWLSGGCLFLRGISLLSEVL